MQTKMLIAGELVGGTGEALSVPDPATGEVIAQVREASDSQLHAAVQSADDAFYSFSRTAPAERATLMLLIADACTSVRHVMVAH